MCKWPDVPMFSESVNDTMRAKKSETWQATVPLCHLTQITRVWSIIYMSECAVVLQYDQVYRLYGCLYISDPTLPTQCSALIRRLIDFEPPHFHIKPPCSVSEPTLMITDQKLDFSLLKKTHKTISNGVMGNSIIYAYYCIKLLAGQSTTEVKGQQWSEIKPWAVFTLQI